MDWEMMAIVGWIGALIINVIFTIDTTKERRKYCEKYEKLWERGKLLEHREAELDIKEYILERRERELEEKRNKPHPYNTGEKALPPTTPGEWSGVPMAERGICGDCVYRKMDCHECTKAFGIGFYDKFEGSGWSEKVIDDNEACRCDCAETTGFCVYYKENEKDVVFCKDCKYGVKMDEPDDWGKEWSCSKDLIGMAWNEEKECCPCGERKEEGGNEE